MKQVLSISVNGEFKQYLMKSEVRYINNMVKDWGKVTVELVEISIAKYKMSFGK